MYHLSVILKYSHHATSTYRNPFQNVMSPYVSNPTHDTISDAVFDVAEHREQYSPRRINAGIEETNCAGSKLMRSRRYRQYCTVERINKSENK
jgi:hypothetical protein